MSVCDHPLSNDKLEEESTMARAVSACRQLHSSEVAEEVLSQGKLACPILLTSLLLFSKSIVSTFFLGQLGDAALAGGSLAIAFANITGYSVIKGLAMGMDPICGQAFGAKKFVLLSHTFQKVLVLLLITTLPISFLWLHMDSILLRLGQDREITTTAKVYLLFSLPDLLAQACLQPLRIFMGMQNLVRPLTACTLIALPLHIPINYVLVVYLRMGVKGVALAAAWNTVDLNLALVAYLCFSDKAIKPWTGASFSTLKGWGMLIKLSVPNAVSVCLEWWWYELMLMLCGLLEDPRACVAAMGILMQTTGLMYVVPSSLGMSLSTRIGHELGGGRPIKARRASIVGLAVSVVCGAMAFGFTMLVQDAWGRMFTHQSQILALTSISLPIIGLCELGNCPQTVGCGVLRGSARPVLGARINFGAFYLVGLPVAAIAAFWLELGFVGLWFGLVAAQASCACLMLYTIAQTDWKVQADRARELTASASAVEENDTERGDLDQESARLLELVPKMYACCVVCCEKHSCMRGEERQEVFQ